MVNHVRTLLLNLPRAGESEEFISSSFMPVSLPSQLQEVYNVLYPASSSRQHKLLLTHTYLNLLASTDFKEHVTRYDTRLTYNLSDSDFFQIDNIAIPSFSDPSFPIFITGSLAYDKARSSSKDQLRVTQVGNTNVIKVTSLTDNSVLYSGNLTFTNGVSNVVVIPQYSIQFYITGGVFTSSSNKTWTFSIEAANKPDFLKTFDVLAKGHAVENMFNYHRKQSTAMYENLWVQHFNKVYKFAGLLLGYVERVNALYV